MSRVRCPVGYCPIYQRLTDKIMKFDPAKAPDPAFTAAVAEREAHLLCCETPRRRQPTR